VSPSAQGVALRVKIHHQPFGADIDPHNLIVFSGSARPADGISELDGNFCGTYSYEAGKIRR
jgi:hypothetical protein